MAAVTVGILARIVELVSEAHGELLVEAHGGLDIEHALVFCEERLIVAEAEVEELIVHRGFEEEGVYRFAGERVRAPGSGHAVVERADALGILDFSADGISVVTADVLAEHPVRARRDGEAFFGVIDEVERVGAESGERSRIVVRGADVEASVLKFEAHAAELLLAENDCVEFRIAPVVVAEGTCAVGEVAEYNACERSELPAELDTVEIEGGEPVRVVTHRRRAVLMTDFGLRCGGVAHIIAMRVSEEGDGNFLIERRGADEVEVLVRGVERTEVLVPVSGIISVEISMNGDFRAECDGGGKQDE